ncbi:IS5/IS1182 family transposase [Actinomadura sp. GC306]|uniref:transposase family protein n=1 Tax=Actinomadura sp. GC306 TaxID=2530367 RepID=UPI00104F4B07|nr:transposase family protein [Actinomadura sp. GC306]TDC57593.1 IS5/IS1182 family transposase [Actinomadura sp. GC306]
MLDVPRELIGFVARLLRAERRARGTRRRTRCLTCSKQALFVIAWFRDKPNITRHGLAFGLSQSTAYRYLHEAVDVLADQAPDLHQALDKAVADGLPHLELDGKIYPSDRCREKTVSVKGEAIDAWFSGKTGGFGGNVQMLCEPDGFPIWFSDVLPGGVVDIEAARALVLPAVYPYAKTMPVLADPGYQGAGHGIIVPFKNPADGNVLSIDDRCRNRLQRFLRCRGERGFALVGERWTALKHTTLSPGRIGDLVRSAHVLTLFEHRRIS